MANKKQTIVSMSLYLAPDGRVHELSARELRLSRKIAGEPDITLKPGGMIVMSTDVNAASESGLIGKIKGFLKTFYNRLFKNELVDTELSRLVREKGLETGWSIGNLFRGRYYSPTSKQVFNEKSFSIDIRGVDFDFVKEAGRFLGKDFEQEKVLLIDHSSGRTLLIDTR